ncbi:hypothetical protein C7U60_09470 [Mesorhizobium plurifarium]|nr:hypothetical protein C7U60_09470 [Mesorhizobium plurifarium]
MNTPSLFKFKDTDIRTVRLDDGPWFVASDVCSSLDMDLHAGTSRWLAGIGAHVVHPTDRSCSRRPGAVSDRQQGPCAALR